MLEEAYWGFWGSYGERNGERCWCVESSMEGWWGLGMWFIFFLRGREERAEQAVEGDTKRNLGERERWHVPRATGQPDRSESVYQSTAEWEVRWVGASPAISKTI